MAISTVSDLVMDVVRAADPTAVQEAQAKLQANRLAYQSAASGTGFTSAIDSISQDATQAGLGNAHVRTAHDKVPAAYHKFEAMVLQNFVKNVLPNSDTLYGKGTAGEMWKGMMSEQLGNQIAKSGGVGIAEQMYRQQLDKTRGAGVINADTDQNDKKMALSSITDFERKTLGTSSTDADSGTTVTNQSTLTSQKV